MGELQADQSRQSQLSRGGDILASPPRIPIRWGRVIALPVVFGATAVAGMVLLKIYPASIDIPWIGLLMLAMAGGVFGVVTTHHHRSQWRRPLHRLEHTLSLVRSGEAAINQLEHIQGPLGELTGQIQEMLRETRRLRAQIAQNNHEMSQRVAQRTDALERQLGSLKLVANRDSMTGLYNRRMYDQHLEVLVKQAMTDGADLCLIMLDLDNFKCLNDTLGHGAGDTFLKSVGQLIRSTIRQEDYGFRCGGDEFVVVLPGADKQAGQRLATRLTSLVDGLGKTIKTPKPLGMSAGLATLWELPQPQLTCLLETADKRLYAVKAERKQAAGLPADRRKLALAG